MSTCPAGKERVQVCRTKKTKAEEKAAQLAMKRRREKKASEVGAVAQQLMELQTTLGIEEDEPAPVAIRNDAGVSTRLTKVIDMMPHFIYFAFEQMHAPELQNMSPPERYQFIAKEYERGLFAKDKNVEYIVMRLYERASVKPVAARRGREPRK